MRRRALLILAIAAPILSLLAFGAQFVPGGYESCTSSIEGPTVCQSLPAVSGWGGPLPYTIAIVLILLSFAPVVSMRTAKRRPATVSAVLQVIPQVISFGGFLFWAPALVATIAFAIAFTEASPLRGPAASGPPQSEFP
jgi:hypothetical protein